MAPEPIHGSGCANIRQSLAQMALDLRAPCRENGAGRHSGCEARCRAARRLPSIGAVQLYDVRVTERTQEQRRKTKTIGVSARPVWIDGPWRTVRPAAGRRNENHGEEWKNDPDLRHGLKNPDSVPNIRSSRLRTRGNLDERVAAQRHVRPLIISPLAWTSAAG